MSEPLIHFIVPFSVLVMCGIWVKKSALLASFAILPDFDLLLEPVMFYHTISIDAPIFTSQRVAITLVILVGLVLRHFLFAFKY